MYAETFELAEHISSCKTGGGDLTVTYRDGNSCTYTDANITLFSETNGGCPKAAYQAGLGEDWDTYDEYLASFALTNGGGCYNAFTDGNFFAS